MRYHVHSLGKNSSSFASVYWNRIEREKKERERKTNLSSLSLSLIRIGWCYLIFSPSLFRSFTRLISFYLVQPSNIRNFFFTMRKIRFRYIKENGKSTSVTVRCSLKRKLLFVFKTTNKGLCLVFIRQE
jgi:hypothetical protein